MDLKHFETLHADLHAARTSLIAATRGVEVRTREAGHLNDGINGQKDVMAKSVDTREGTERYGAFAGAAARTGQRALDHLDTAEAQHGAAMVRYTELAKSAVATYGADADYLRHLTPLLDLLPTPEPVTKTAPVAFAAVAKTPLAKSVLNSAPAGATVIPIGGKVRVGPAS